MRLQGLAKVWSRERHSTTVFWGLLEHVLRGCILTSPTDDLWAHPLDLSSNVTSQTPQNPCPPHARPLALCYDSTCVRSPSTSWLWDLGQGPQAGIPSWWPSLLIITHRCDYVVSCSMTADLVCLVPDPSGPSPAPAHWGCPGNSP